MCGDSCPEVEHRTRSGLGWGTSSGEAARRKSQAVVNGSEGSETAGLPSCLGPGLDLGEPLLPLAGVLMRRADSGEALEPAWHRLSAREH